MKSAKSLSSFLLDGFMTVISSGDKFVEGALLTPLPNHGILYSCRAFTVPQASSPFACN